MLFNELGYTILKQEKVTVGIVEDHTEINSTVHIHNAGANTAYIDINPGVTTDKWDITPGEKIGPLSIKTLYHIGTAETTLKLLYLKGV